MNLKAIIPHARQADINRFTQPLIDTMQRYSINTPLRQAAFIAQIAHESGLFKYVREIASGAAYEGRKDLGNTQPGDGKKYKGRGLIQITGRANYAAISKDFGVDFISNPELLETPQYAALSAGWYWNTRKLNELADKGNFREITRRINGGFKGYAEREKYYFEALKKLQAN